MRLRIGTLHLPVAMTSILALGASAHAETLSYGVDAGVAQTDNVTLASKDTVSQTIAVADLDFDYKKQSRLLDVDAKGNFSYLDYLQNAYNSQLVGRFDGVLRAAIIPDRLTWAVQDNFGQMALDAFAPTTPVNLENVNYFTTGPDLTERIGSTSFVDASARYARATYETSPYNSNRWLGSLAWGLNLSARSSVSLNGDYERVEFENTVVNTDFDRSNVYVHYKIEGARTELSADIGATKVTQGGGSDTGGLAKFELSRKISAAAKLTLSAGHVLTDASTSFSNIQSGATGVTGTAPAAQTSNNYTSDYVSLGWHYMRNRTTIGISGRWEQNKYSDEPSLDYTRSGMELNLERRLTRSLTAQFAGRYYRSDYTHAVVAPGAGATEYEDGSLGAGLSWRHGRGLDVRLRYAHTWRTAPGTDEGYGENRVMLTVGYRPEPRQDNPPEE